MNVLKTASVFCFVFIEGMESRIQANSTELVSWLIVGRIVSVASLFILILILGILLALSTSLTDCEDRFLVITDTPVAALFSTQETF